MRHLGLRLEDCPHQLGEVRVDLDDLLELVEHERDTRPRSAASSPGSVSSRSRVASTSAGARPGSKPNETDEVLGVDRDRRRDPQAAEDAERPLARPEKRGGDPLVDRLRELLGELLLRRRRHQVDLRAEHTLALRSWSALQTSEDLP